MNNTQRIIVLVGAIVVASLFHIYFCDCRIGMGGRLFPLFNIKVDGKQWKELLINRYYARRNYIESSSSHVSRWVLEKRYERLNTFDKSIDNIDDSTQYDAVYGLYPRSELSLTFVGPANRTTFVFGIILPILVLIIGAFIATGGTICQKQLSTTLHNDRDTS